MKLLLLPPRIGKEAAIARLRRRRMLNLYGLLRPRPVRQDPDGTATSLELFWLPAYRFRAQLTHAGKKAKSEVSVDASFGGFALFGRSGELREEAAEGEIFPPLLQVEEARHIAKEELIRYILRKRGAKPELHGIEGGDLFYVPAWIYYFRRMGGKIDFKVLDAYSGSPMGGRMKQAIIQGLIARRRVV